MAGIAKEAICVCFINNKYNTFLVIQDYMIIEAYPRQSALFQLNQVGVKFLAES